VYSLSFQREIVLFRVVQEILQNAIKHSGASQLTIHLTYTPALVNLTASDNGKGFNYQAVNKNGLNQSGAGLRNIQRRVILIGGTCSFVSAEGKGTTILITLPNSVA
jgi:two-component system, NarL family, sensor kinase